MPRAIQLLAIALTAGLIVACDRQDTGAATPDASVRVGVVDSALPIDTLLRRFRATLPDTPSVLRGGAASPEALARTLLTSLQANDTAALRALVISPAEFAWLYYPHTKWTKPPYEMGPELVWLQVSAGSEKGFVRLARRYGGRALRFERLACPDSALAQGPVTVTEGCRLIFAVADSAPRELRLFGSLLNRDGRYKFVSYSNDL